MGLKHHQFGNVMVNLFHGAVTVPEVTQSMEAARTAHRIHGPLTGITINGRDLKFPDPDVRSYMVEHRKTMLSYHRSMHMVLPAGHFAAMRIGMFIVESLTLGTASEVAHHKTVAEALTEGERLRRATPGLSGYSTPIPDILAQLERLKIPLT
ncbi:hypothetical protein IT087_03780 [Candidatus Uhrbacteria bacterium]|nr:hypothetical protein [Candidatus Uhrbacteria bacterium]